MSEVQTVDDNFLVGLLFLCLFGAALLVFGKVLFGIVYMIALSDFVLLYHLFKFMSRSDSAQLTVAQFFTVLS
jgi:hypothetical protein